MKRFIAIAAAVLATLACTKEYTKQFRGYYSFKTGGSVEISGKIYTVKEDTVKIDTIPHVVTLGPLTFRDTTYNYHVKLDTIASRDTTVTRHIVAESGQMHILEDGTDRMKVTMNVTGGDPVVFDASADSDNITLSPVKRYITVSTDGLGIPSRCWMNVSGSGKRYEDMIIFNLTYQGDYNFEDIEGTVTKSDINCIATVNE
ncbi:MAG: hypothetical protein IJV32_02120 [Bacteroidales bacterium]|nr:hypothetical protein [Bacteroidales bacterium]